MNDGRSGEELASPEAWGSLNQAERYNDLRGPLWKNEFQGTDKVRWEKAGELVWHFAASWGMGVRERRVLQPGMAWGAP